MESFVKDKKIIAAYAEVFEDPESPTVKRLVQMRQITVNTVPTGAVDSKSAVTLSAATALGRDTAIDIRQTRGENEEAVDSLEEENFVKSTGEAVDTLEIASVGENATVTVNGTETVPLNDVSFGDERTHLAYSRVTGVEGMTAEAANKILSNPKAERFDFINEAIRAFQGGLRNDGKIADKLDYKILTAAEARALFEEGRKAAEAQVTARDAEVKAKQKTATEDSSAAERKGGVFYEYDGKTIKQRNDGKHKPLTKKQRVAVNFTERLAKKFGSTVFFYESYEENGKRMYKDRDGNIREAKEGFYDPSDGSIHVDLNGDNILFTVSHELVHFIRDWSPVQFKKMADLVMKGFNRQGLTAEELIEAKQADYAEDGITLTEEQAFEEVIAASLEGIMADGRVMELLQAAEAKDKRLGAKLRQFFQDVKDLIRDTISSYKDAVPGSPEGRLIRKLEDIYSQLQEAFAEGVMDAGENFQNAENTTGDSGLRFSLVIKSRDGTVTLEDPTKLSREKILNYLNLSRMGRLDEKSYFPVAAHTPEIIIETLKNAGIDITDKPLAMQAKKAKQSQNNHDIHSSNGYIIRGHAMSANEILEVIDKLYKPEAIIQETERTAKVKIDGVTELKYLPDAFVFFVHLESGKECVAVIEFDSTIDSNYIVKDGANDEYHTTITIFEPDVTRNGKPYDYYEYLIHKRGNYEIDIVEKNSNPKTAYGENLTTVSEKEFSADTVPQPKTVVKKISTTDSDGNQLSAGQQPGSNVTETPESVSKQDDKVLLVPATSAIKAKAEETAQIYGNDDVATVPFMDRQYVVQRKSDGTYSVGVIGNGSGGFIANDMFEDGFSSFADASEYAIRWILANDNEFKTKWRKTYAELTTNKNPTDHPDIRYSIGSKTDGAVQALLEKENDALREDVARLKELLKLQGTETHGTRFTPSSVEAAARYLKKNAGAKGDTKTLAKLLNGFYEYIATNKDLTWDDVREQLEKVDAQKTTIKQQRIMPGSPMSTVYITQKGNNIRIEANHPSPLIPNHRPLSITAPITDRPLIADRPHKRPPTYHSLPA